jgi:transposase
MERIAMSQQERDELDWLKRVRDGSITQREAAEKMGMSDRWVRVLLKRMSKQGDGVVVHGLRGRPSNRKLEAETQRQALTILRQQNWYDFGPTFAAEQLAKRHQIEVGKETLRGWMIRPGCGRANRSGWSRRTFGGRGGLRLASWCSGTLPSTTGWKAEGGCVTWRG